MDDELVCICDQPFRLAECPVHPVEKSEDEEEEEQYAEEVVQEVVVTVTPAHREDATKKTGWIGFSFLCDNCGKNSILEWFKYCPECKAKIDFTFKD